ncbi:MAG: MFS transporter [Simkaniaceae bacterium]|nr:MFS transporter [Candidatus Sacchlamyda saccharinae]
MSSVKKSLAIIGATMGALSMGLSFSLINANLESIHQHFGASLVQLQWMINIYGIFIASTLVTMGRLGDIYGRKKIYLIGLFLFGVAMLGGGLAFTPGMIIGFQALYGLAGAILLPLSQAMLIDCFSEDQKSLAVGIWTGSGAITLSLGPIIGGLLLEFLSWRWIFLANVPFAIFGLLLTAFFAKDSKTEGESTKLDWPGVILLTLAIGTFVFATVQFNLWQVPVIVLLYVIAALCIVGLLIVEGKVEMPIIREELFRSRMFLFSCAGNFCMIAFFWAGIFLIPLYIQKQLDFSPLHAGVLMLAFSVPIALISPIIGHLYKTVGPKVLISVGFCLMGASALMQLQYGDTISPYFIALATFCLGLGFGFVWTPTTTGALSAISRNFAGIASGTFITIQEIGGNMGLAVTATVARMSPSFTGGFHNAMWVMFGVCILGICTAFFLPRRPRVLKKL